VDEVELKNDALPDMTFQLLKRCIPNTLAWIE